MIVNDENRERTLRIWSAGCSTGEEPYTLAMLVQEYLQGKSGWNIEILGSDISEAALHAARTAEYSGPTLRELPPELLEKYFIGNGETYKIVPEIRSMVKFAQSNLSDPRRQPITNSFDIIFCRNVLTYFDDDVRRTLIRNFYNSLLPGGYLFIGHTETLHGLSKAFRLTYFRNALVYRKVIEAAPVQNVSKGTQSSTKPKDRKAKAQ